MSAHQKLPQFIHGQPSMGLPFEKELVVDLFAGGGGASTGIACCAEPLNRTLAPTARTKRYRLSAPAARITPWSTRSWPPSSPKCANGSSQRNFNAQDAADAPLDV